MAFLKPQLLEDQSSISLPGTTTCREGDIMLPKSGSRKSRNGARDGSIEPRSEMEVDTDAEHIRRQAEISAAECEVLT